MITAVKLNNVTLNHKDGLIYVDNLNETLDSGVVVIEGANKLNINPMDEMLILLDDVWKKYLVSEYVEEVASYEPAKYNYQIQYVSVVLKFERITLPNLAITKVYKPTESENYLIKEGNYYSRSVGYYIRQYLKEYYLEDDILINESENLFVKADATICPEMTFNRPNLREVIQALCDVVDLIFTLRYSASANKFYISSISPNVKKNPIDTSKLNSDVVRNSINTYASNLDVELTNAISSPKLLTTTTQILTVRSDTGILTTDNGKIILDNPIYNIRKVEVNVATIIDTENPSLPWWVDITDYVLEQSVYEGLDTTGGSIHKKAKDNCLYYKQGSNTIEGLGKTHKWLGIIESAPVIAKVLNCGAYSEGYGWINFEDFVEYHFYDMMFRIEYETIQDIRLQTERDNKLPHNSTLFDSQEASYVNVENFVKNSLSKLNRMSNNERMISAVYTNYSDVPELGDYIDNYILTNREMSIYDNYIAFNGVLTKDYSNIYQFNAINSKKRFYQIATDETLIRHELIKLYLSYSYTKDTIADEDEIYERIAISFALQSSNNPKFVLLKYSYTKDDGTSSSEPYYIATEVTSYHAGATALFTFGFDNNILAGIMVGDSGAGGYYMQPVKYVDYYGENTKMLMEFWETSNAFTYTDSSDYKEFWEKYGKYYPRIKDESTGYLFDNKRIEVKTEFHKDQREIQKWTLQLTQLSDEEDIIIGPRMIERNMFIKEKYRNVNDDIQGLEVWKFPQPLNRNELENIDFSKGELIEDSRPYVGIDDGFYIKAKHSGNIVFVDAQYNQKTESYDRYVYLVLNNYTADKKIYCNVNKIRK